MKEYIIQVLASLTTALILYLVKNYKVVKTKIYSRLEILNYRLILVFHLGILDLFLNYYLITKAFKSGWDIRDFYLTLAILLITIFSAFAYYYSKYYETRYVS